MSEPTPSPRSQAAHGGLSALLDEVFRMWSRAPAFREHVILIVAEVVCNERQLGVQTSRCYGNEGTVSVPGNTQHSCISVL